MLNWTRCWLIDKNCSSPGAMIGVCSVQAGLVRRCEPVRHAQPSSSAEFHGAVTVVGTACGGIKRPIARQEIKIAATIPRWGASAHPDATSRVGDGPHMVGSRVKNSARYLCQRRCVIPDNPAVIRIAVLVRSPGDIYNSVEQSKAGPLMFVSRIERYPAAYRSVPGTGDGYGVVDRNGAARLFISVRQIQRVEALEKREWTCNGRLADDVERVGDGIDDRRAGDTGFGSDIAKASAYQAPGTGCHRSFTRRAAMSRVDQIGTPERCARIRIAVRIECVNAIVLCGDDNDVVHSGANGEVGDPQWLGVDGAIHAAREELAEGGSLDAGSCQREFVRVSAVAREIVVIGGDAREVGYGERGGCALGRVGNARRRYGDIAHSVWSDERRGGVPLTAESPAGSRPCHASRADVVLKVRRKIQGLRKSRSTAHRCDRHADRSRCRQGCSRAGVTAEIPCGVGGAHAIRIGGGSGQASVVEGGGCRCGYLSEIRACCSRAALGHVAGDADVVGRGRPGKIDPRVRGRADYQVCWCSRWCGVRRSWSAGAGCAGVGAQVVRGVGGAHAIRIGGGSGQASVAEGRGRGRGDLREVRAGCALAALDPVASDANVVGRG